MHDCVKGSFFSAENFMALSKKKKKKLMMKFATISYSTTLLS